VSGSIKVAYKTYYMMLVLLLMLLENRKCNNPVIIFIETKSETGSVDFYLSLTINFLNLVSYSAKVFRTT